MKKIFALMLGIAAMFASCSKTEELTAGTDAAREVTFLLSADSGLQTRAAGTLRYLMAIYDESGQTEVLKATEYGSNSFAVRLDPGKYSCLFWADHGSENYDATDLKSVAMKDAATEVEAFYAKQGITVTDGGTVNVTLSRTVAKLVLKETDRLEAGSITVSYDGFKGYDVSQGAGINASTLTHTITVASVIEGSAAAPTEVGSILMLAGSDERILTDFKFQYKTATKTEDERTITNVPVQANYVTNVNGKFSVNVAQQFSITIDDSWATPEKEVDFPPYLTFSAADEQKFGMEFIDFLLGTGEYFEYAVGDGGWTRFTTTVSNIAFGGTHGDLRLRGKSSKGTANNYWSRSKISFGTSGVLVDCSGDIRTLIDYENYEAASTADARFCSLFQGNQLLRTAPELPATTLADWCYRDMFNGCTSLTQAPELPATTLADWCYQDMFNGCTSLTKAPELPATTLADWCYQDMFNGCTSLTQAPKLPATTLAASCYTYMFAGCTSLTQAPELPATTLADYCYTYMFAGCTSLTQAPELPATTLADWCYQDMFNGCTSLTQAPKLPATTLADFCYREMFYGCTSLTQAPKLPATTLAASCYYYMFNGCTSLTQAPELPATTLSKSCYSYMFCGCTSLTQASELPATTLSKSCYHAMFDGCTSLTQAPELPATTLADYCYWNMFLGCTSLTTAPALPATTLADYCYYYMFSGCTKLSEVTMLATTKVGENNSLTDWLIDAGTQASSRTLTVANSEAYSTLESYLPDNWKQGAEGTTVKFN